MKDRLKAIAKPLVHRLPPGWFAWLEYRFRPSARGHPGGAFNGQSARRRLFEDLVRTVPLRAIVETGTFRGATAEFMSAASRLPVHTVESDPRYFHYSRLRLSRAPNVRVYLGDSRTLLQALAADPAFPRSHALFYLDAHWNDDLPLREELSLIARHWTNALVLIDDFEVPGDSGYRFDDYGAGKKLCLDYLPPLESLGLEPFFPSAPSSEESGDRRGCVVLASKELAPKLAELRSLRRYPR